MKHILFWIAVIFSSGIAAVGAADAPFALLVLIILSALLVCLFSLKRRIIFGASLCCLAFFMGAAVYKNSQILPPDHISRRVFSGDDSIYLVKGIIAEEPQIKSKRVSFVLNASLIQDEEGQHNCSGKLQVSVKGGKDFYYGDEVALRGRLSLVSDRNESYRRYLAGQGVYAVMKVELDEAALKLGTNKGFFLKRFALVLKEKMGGVIDDYLPKISAGILKAMVLGDKAAVAPAIYDSMIKAGTVHILVVSGFNVGIVAFVVLLLLRALRLPKVLRLLTAALCLAVYCLATGASNPVVRATVMAMVFILADILEREADIYNSLGIAALFILALNPAQLFDVGFQLSFISVLAIVYIYPKLKSLFRLEAVKTRWLRGVIEGSLVSLAAWIGTAGFIVYYFRIISPVAVLANIFIVPLAALMTLSGFCMVVAAAVFPPLAQMIAPANELLAALLLRINFMLLKVPGACFYI